VGLANLGSELETCVGSCVRLVGVFISFEKNFYRLPFTPPLSGSPYRSFNRSDQSRAATPPSSVLWSWLCGSTKKHSGFLVNHQKPRELGVASANHHS
jgi:hypothetical protein